MEEHLQRETDNLTRSWMQHDAGMLRDYLVGGVEDPRLNVQSILTRHSLIVAQFGNRFDSLIEQELRFASVMNWARALAPELGSDHDLAAIRHALATGGDNAEGIPVPGFVAATFQTLSDRRPLAGVPNYLEDLFARGWPAQPESWPDEAVLSTFQKVWHGALAGEAASGLSVLEVACGSANDYRFLEAYGLARLIEYTGMDLCEKNVANARAMFPGARFLVGNVLALDAPDQAFDCCLVQDLLEHLSLEGLERALQEISRVTRRQLCLGLFNGHEGDEHLVRPLNDYHWNSLSVPRLVTALRRQRFEVQVVHIDTLLRWRLGCPDTHNKQAYTVLAERP